MGIHKFLGLTPLSYRLLLKFPFLQRVSTNQLKQINYLLNFLLIQLLKVENYLLSLGINFPIGVSVFVVAQKPSKG